MNFTIVWMALLLGAFAVVFCGLSIWISLVETKFFDGSTKSDDE
jgi:hypothetical protein